MEENNKSGSNINSSLYESSLYGTQPQPPAEESGQSSVYGQQNTQPPVQLNEPPVRQTDIQGQVPVSLEKPNHQEQPQPVMPEQIYQAVNPNQINPNQLNPNQLNNGCQLNYYNGQYNVQQMNPNQGIQYAHPKKNKTGLIIGIAAAAVMILIVVCLFLVKSLFAGPQRQLAKGMLNMKKEMEAYSSSISEEIGFDELRAFRKNQPMHTNLDVSFTDPNASGKFDNVSIEIDAISDIKNKQAEFDLKVGTYGIDMEIGSVVADSDILYFSSPLVLKEDVYCLKMESLGRDFNNSAWAKLFNTTIPDDTSYTLFKEKDDNLEENSKAALEFGRIIGKHNKRMAGAITYAFIKEKREFTNDGALKEFGGVQVTVDKETYNASVEMMKDDILSSDFYADYLDSHKSAYGSSFDDYKKELDGVIEQILGIRFENDPVLNFYLDKKGRIINISTPEDLAVSSQSSVIDSIAVDIDFGGAERTLDSVEGGIYMQAEGEILYLGVSRTAHVSEDFYNEDLTVRLQSDIDDDDIVLHYGNDWGYADRSYDMTLSITSGNESMVLTADGGFENIVKGEGYAFRVNNAALTMNDEKLLLMRGMIAAEPEKKNKIEVPGNATDILKMSEDDIESALYKAVYSIQNLMYE